MNRRLYGLWLILLSYGVEIKGRKGFTSKTYIRSKEDILGKTDEELKEYFYNTSCNTHSTNYIAFFSAIIYDEYDNIVRQIYKY